MRSELIRQLFQAYVDDDDQKFIDIANSVISEEEKKNHVVLAKDLKKIISNCSQTNLYSKSISKRYKKNIPIPRDSEKGFPLLEIREYHNFFDDIVLDEENLNRLRLIIQEFENRDVLKSYGLRPKQKILFSGPPGTGKTLSAKIISSELGYPLVYIRFDSIVSSYLGETASNLRKIFNFIERGEWVVLFDEFDIIGKKRDDPYEHGEIKRVVNNFMQMLDDYCGEGIVIAATNHPHLLDTAIWRRFDDIILFDKPDLSRREQLYKKFLKIINKPGILDFNQFAVLSDGFSPADIAQVCEEAIRRLVIANRSQMNADDIIWAIKNQNRKKEIIEGSDDGKQI